MRDPPWYITKIPARLRPRGLQPISLSLFYCFLGVALSEYAAGVAPAAYCLDFKTAVFFERLAARKLALPNGLHVGRWMEFETPGPTWGD